LSVLVIALDAAANAQDHRPVPQHQCREGHFAAGVTSRCKLLRKLTIRQTGHGSIFKRELDVSKHFTFQPDTSEGNSGKPDLLRQLTILLRS
jgi:hypothetical protein